MSQLVVANLLDGRIVNVLRKALSPLSLRR